ncbi:MAG: glutathione transferase GstA [Proteobacteria bacterium]|jgi:glutathione S-transferase|nr:glutathione transferase GstA [Pseudomonadota bacterium]
MKLYYATGACSLAPHIALSEAGLPFELVRVDLGTHKLTNGADYTKINPKGYVPLLELDNGERLSEVAVILQYIADRKPGTLAPAFGSMERYRVMEWLNFVATEIHKGMGPLWKADIPESVKKAAMDALSRRFDYVAATLAKQPYLTGSSFTIADAYLFTIVNWHNFLKFDLARWPALQAFQERVAARPKVNDALVAEHLVKKTAAATA